MSNTSFSFYSNIFGFIVGGVSLLGFVVRLCRTHLPSNKIKTLEALLHETENTFRSAVEDGLLVDKFVQMAQNRLALYVRNFLPPPNNLFHQVKGGNLQFALSSIQCNQPTPRLRRVRQWDFDSDWAHLSISREAQSRSHCACVNFHSDALT